MNSNKKDISTNKIDKDNSDLLGRKSTRNKKLLYENLNENKIRSEKKNKYDSDEEKLTLSQTTYSEELYLDEKIREKEISTLKNLNTDVNKEIKNKFELTMSSKSDKPLKLVIHGKYLNARASTMYLRKCKVNLPIFMPVGTKAAMKGLLSSDLERMNCKLMLSNTYHLALQPGDEYIHKNYKSVHNMMKWKNNVLTDSGGFQMVSLDKNTVMCEEGVTFKSHIKGDDRTIFLTPEKSIEIQNNLDSDIMMMLDDVVRPNSSEDRIKEATERTIRWLDRCITANKNKDQCLFPIVQGGLNDELRKWCAIEMTKRDMPGYAIGGLAGGEEKEDFWKAVKVSCENLPQDKPRYLMGLGYPIDLVVCVVLGCDMFDCVFPTRTARFGTAFTKNGFIKLDNKLMKLDFNSIDNECKCEVCIKYTRSYLYLLGDNPRRCSLISFHNVYYLLNLMKEMRKSILLNECDKFVNNFISEQLKFSNDEELEKNKWILNALDSVGFNTSYLKHDIYKYKS